MSYANEGDKRQKLIQWDEETIAEHDRERGSRQKIDEAPTPYRYLSESDQSECESGGSDGEGFKQKIRTNSVEDHYVSPPTKINSVGDSWETINAKLNYQKHLQDVSDGTGSHHDHYLNGGVGGLNSSSDYIPGELRTEFGELLDTQMDGESVAALNTRLNKTISSVGGIRTSGDRHSSSNATSTNAPISTVFMKHNEQSILKHTLSGSSVVGCGSNSPIFTSHHHLHGSNTHISPAGVAAAGNLNNSNGNSSSYSSSNNQHSHHHQHQIHFSNSPLSSPYPSTTSANGGNRSITSSGDGSATTSMFAGINGSIGGSDHTSTTGNLTFGHLSPRQHGGGTHSDELSPEVTQFRNKRAGHYNEYKVLQAMRAKLAAEDSDDGDEDEDNSGINK